RYWCGPTPRGAGPGAGAAHREAAFRWGGQRSDEGGSRGKRQGLAEVLPQSVVWIDTPGLDEGSQVAPRGIFQAGHLDGGAGDGPALQIDDAAAHRHIVPGHLQGKAITGVAASQPLPVEGIARGRGRHLHELPGAWDRGTLVEDLAAEDELESAVRAAHGLWLIGSVVGHTQFGAGQGLTIRVEHAAVDNQ